MTKEEKIKSIELILDTAKQAATVMIKAFTPPTQEEMTQHLARLSDLEVEGIYRYGSKKGRRLAKIECLKRGIIKKSFFKRLFKK